MSLESEVCRTSRLYCCEMTLCKQINVSQTWGAHGMITPTRSFHRFQTQSRRYFSRVRRRSITLLQHLSRATNGLLNTLKNFKSLRVSRSREPSRTIFSSVKIASLIHRRSWKQRTWLPRVYQSLQFLKRHWVYWVYLIICSNRCRWNE
jgi:hypothetical protein